MEPPALASKGQEKARLGLSQGGLLPEVLIHLAICPVEGSVPPHEQVSVNLLLATWASQESDLNFQPSTISIIPCMIATMASTRIISLPLTQRTPCLTSGAHLALCAKSKRTLSASHFGPTSQRAKKRFSISKNRKTRCRQESFWTNR